MPFSACSDVLLDTLASLREKNIKFKMNKVIRRSLRGNRRGKVPTSVDCNSDHGMRYYSRRFSNTIRTYDVRQPLLVCMHCFSILWTQSFCFFQLPMESDAIGYWSPWTILWFGLFSVAPLAYFYIVLMLLRDLCVAFPGSIYEPLQLYVPYVASLADRMKGSSRLVDFWCVIEALFFICFQLKFRYLNSKDPLEASLSAAPMYDPEERKLLWDRIMDAEKEDLGYFISGWFFDEPIENISRYDVCDFFCWCMFDGRNQEHLTTLELHELESFVEDIEYRISIQLYGAQPENENGEATTRDDGIADQKQHNNLKEGRLWSPKRLRMNSEDAMSSASDLSSFSTHLYPLPNKSEFQNGFVANLLYPISTSPFPRFPIPSRQRSRRT